MRLIFLIGIISWLLTFSKAQVPDTLWTKDYGNREVFSLGFSPDGNRIAVGFECPFPALRIVDAWNGDILFETNTQQLCLQTVQVSTGGNYLAIGEEVGWLYVYDFTTYTAIDSFDTGNGGIFSLDFHPNGNAVMVAGLDGYISVYKIGTGELLLRFLAHSTGVIAVDYSADGNLIVSGGKDKLVKLWNANNGNFIREFNGHMGEVRDVNFIPDASRIISCSADDDIRIWETATGNCLHTITEHWADVNNIDVAPDGIHFASASTDQTIKLFRVDDGSMVVSFGSEVPSKKNWLDFSPDGMRLAAGHQNGVLGVWNMGPTLGTESLNVAPSIVVYPNPATHFIQLQNVLLPAQLTLYNLYGQIVYQKPIKSTHIDIQPLAEGLYLGIIHSEKNKTIHSFKIQIVR